MKKKTIINTARWINGAGIGVHATYEFDKESGGFVFRTHGEPSIKVAAAMVIGLESFRWNTPIILELEAA